MGSSSQKFIVATKQEILGYQRKLAWFSLHKRDLYFEMAGILEGSHSSYHKDGSIWRTSTATNKKPKYVKHHYPLNRFHGWFNLGMGMLLKSSFPYNPELKARDKKHQIQFIDIDCFPSEALNPTSCFFLTLSRKIGYFPSRHLMISIGYVSRW